MAELGFQGVPWDSAPSTHDGLILIPGPYVSSSDHNGIQM